MSPMKAAFLYTMSCRAIPHAAHKGSHYNHDRESRIVWARWAMILFKIRNRAYQRLKELGSDVALT